ncbi:MAG TPA: hypothetical protein VM345_08205 [Acidimicrobiales bacterium]|jgi:hypothetical protein|nr:hypothetical protein [Acidimicrobiales bacterium]
MAPASAGDGGRSVAATPTLETLFVAVIALLGLRLGLRPIGDNSTFVHLRTGIDIVDGLGVPRRDPYSFTAAGDPWVVQSWLVSVLYGITDRIAGAAGLVILHGVLYAALGWLLGTLARAATPMRTAAAALLAVGVGVAYWSPRPLVVGLLAMGVTVLAVERRLAPWILVPVAWIWVNSHGSFVLGGVWLVLVIVAASNADRRHLVRYLAWFAGGVAFGAVNPIGPRLLLFPFVVVEKRASFAQVVEWRPPFPPRNPFVVIAVVSVVVVVVVLATAVVRHRVRLLDLVPSAVFMAMGLLSQRNLAAAAVVVAPVLGRALRPRAESAHADLHRPPIHRAIAAVIVVAAAVFVAAAAVGDPLDLDAYPPRRAFDAAAGADRIITTDVVGCYRILREGRGADVFIDDRYDLYPEQVIDDYLVLRDGGGRSLQILDRYRADAVIWPRDAELAAILGRNRDWRRAFADGDWVVYVRGV